MNDKLTEKILSEARASLDPTPSDRNRMNRRIMGAIGAATVATTATAGAAKTAGWLTTGLGIPAGVVTVVKATTGGLLLSGFIALGIAGVNAFDPGSKSKIKSPDSTSQTAIEKTESASKAAGANHISIANEKETSAEEESLTVIEREITEKNAPMNPLTAVQTGSASSSKRKSNKVVKLSTSAPAASPSPNDDGLLQEIALIKAASGALRREDYSMAVGLLLEYQEKYPSGTMRQERDGLYISALCGSGQINAARQADKSFRRRYNKPPLMFGVERQCSTGSQNE